MRLITPGQLNYGTHLYHSTRCLRQTAVFTTLMELALRKIDAVQLYVLSRRMGNYPAVSILFASLKTII